MRSIWKGHIRFSLVTIPVQIFNAVEKGNDISFKQLHSEDNGRISYKKTCNICDEEVPYGDIVKGYEYEPDQYVVLKKKKNSQPSSLRVTELSMLMHLWMWMRCILLDLKLYIMLGQMVILQFRLSIYSEKHC